MNDYLKDDFKDIINLMTDDELKVYGACLNSIVNNEIREKKSYKRNATKNR